MLQGMCVRQNCRQLSLLHTSPEMFATYLLIWWDGFPDRVIPGSAASDILAVESFSTLSIFACNENKNVPKQIIDFKWYTNYEWPGCSRHQYGLNVRSSATKLSEDGRLRSSRSPLFTIATAAGPFDWLPILSIAGQDWTNFTMASFYYYWSNNN